MEYTYITYGNMEYTYITYITYGNILTSPTEIWSILTSPTDSTGGYASVCEGLSTCVAAAVGSRV